MRLTNRQLNIIVNKIYNTVYKSLTETNEKLKSKIKVPNHQYFKDFKKFTEYQEEIESLKCMQSILEDKYAGNTINGFSFRQGFPVFRENTRDKYTSKIIFDIAGLKKIPTRQEIEEDVILSSNKDISKLIKSLTESYLK